MAAIEAAPSVNAVMAEARACQVCAPALPHAPRPIFRIAVTARLLLIGQAPGRRVHESGTPWDDPSGDRLRDWLGLDRATFYDERRVAIVPMGLCYPGTEDGADLPPRPECAPLWHRRLLALLPEVRFTILIGRYAQTFHLPTAMRRGGIGDTVQASRSELPHRIALPHPSWRNTGWLKRNPWFETDIVPILRNRTAAVLSES